jgi:uncharacterized protein with von Willebrand factor type A (vWA) domain
MKKTLILVLVLLMSPLATASDEMIREFEKTLREAEALGITGPEMEQLRQLLEQAKADSASSNDSSTYGSSGFLVDKEIYVDCPAGRRGPIPIKAKSQECASAMESYGRAAVCNDIDRLPGTEKAYYSACADEMY